MDSKNEKNDKTLNFETSPVNCPLNSDDKWTRELANLESLANLVNKSQDENITSSDFKNENSSFFDKDSESTLEFMNSSKANPLLDKLLGPIGNTNLNNEETNSDSENPIKKENGLLNKNLNINNEINKRKRIFNSRKNIKKLMTDEDLDESVLSARHEEEERINRIREQQQKCQVQQNKIVEDIILSSDEEIRDDDIIEISGTIKEKELQKEHETGFNSSISGLHTDDSLNVPDINGNVLVNVGHPESDPDIFLSQRLAQRIKPHQIGGIRFMYDCIVENLTKFKTSEGLGCILAHSMGLGKTMQIISFIEVFTKATKAKYILCIVPINTLHNWIAEFDNWFPLKKKNNQNDESQKNEENYRTFPIYSLSDSKTFTLRANEILTWRKTGGVFFMGYEMYRLLLNEESDKSKNKKPKKINYEGLSEEGYLKLHESIRKALVDPGPDLVVCDEGHRIKNANASTSKALKQLKTKRRIVLTGYPLQNNLVEYWCMVDFVRPGYLGTKTDFTNMFEKPIQNGNCTDSTEIDRKIMRKRAHVLHKLLRGFVQRRSHSVLTKSLPLKHEHVILVRMTPTQKALMLEFFKYLATLTNEKMKANPLIVYAVCYKIWNHPDIINKILTSDDVTEDLEFGISSKKTKLSKI